MVCLAPVGRRRGIDKNRHRSRRPAPAPRAALPEGRETAQAIGNGPLICGRLLKRIPLRDLGMDRLRSFVWASCAIVGGFDLSMSRCDIGRFSAAAHRVKGNVVCERVERPRHQLSLPRLACAWRRRCLPWRPGGDVARPSGFRTLESRRRSAVAHRGIEPRLNRQALAVSLPPARGPLRSDHEGLAP